MRANKLVLSKLVLGLAAALLAISIVGCAKNAQPLTSTDTAATLGEPTTTTAETSPAKTEAEETTKYSEETQAATTESTVVPDEDQAETTEEATVAQTQSADTGDSVTSTSQTTSPPETDAPVTELPHNHSYQKTDSVAATCTTDGYTLYECSCGSSYKENETPATGHRWAEWTVIKYPTTASEGEKLCTCGYCGSVETVAIEKLPEDHEHEYREVYYAATCQHPAHYRYLCDCGDTYKSEYIGELAEHYMVTYEVVPATPDSDGYHLFHCGYEWDGCTETKTLVLKYENQVVDTAKLEEYGRQYGKDTYGYNPVIGTRAGYYPGLSVTITSMEDGYHDVADAVDSTTQQLLAAGCEIVAVIDGKECAARLDVEVVHEGGNNYCIWVYYG